MVFIGNSPVVQWLRHCTFNAPRAQSTPGGKLIFPQAVTQSNAPSPHHKEWSSFSSILSVQELKLKVMIQGPIGLVTK